MTMTRLAIAGIFFGLITSALCAWQGNGIGALGWATVVMANITILRYEDQRR